MPLLPEPAYTHGTPNGTAVILINLGTPEEPTAPALRRYLKEFLSDPRVVEIPRLVWWFILNVIILNLRPKKSAAKYASIWMPEGSPLRVFTERQTKLVRGYLGNAGLQVKVVHAMRYGAPSIDSVIDGLHAENCGRILLLPLYPQYAGSTSATAFDAAYRHLTKIRNQPEIRTVRSFADHPGYIAALAASVREHWMKNGHPEKNYRLMLSFHGVPKFTLDRGDPYHCECQKTARLLREALGLAADQFQVCFQSRFGKAEWLQPYTAGTLKSLAEGGIQRVDVLCPGFVADCLETLEEIAMEGKETFLAAGGKSFHYIPCLNERADWIAALADITASHLQGWPVGADNLSHGDSLRSQNNVADAAQSALRAKAMGAAR